MAKEIDEKEMRLFTDGILFASGAQSNTGILTPEETEPFYQGFNLYRSMSEVPQSE